MNDDAIGSIAFIIVLMALSAFFSGAETALTAASRARMHHLEKTGVRRARLVNALRANKERLIGTLLLGNTLINIMASAVATKVLVEMFSAGTAALLATGIMTALILIFCEVLPKTYAINNPDRAALALAPLLRPVVAGLAPISRAVQVIVLFLLRLMGARARGDGASFAAEELRGAIDLHRRPGGAAQHQRFMLRGVLDLEEVEVGEIMIHRRDVAMIDIDQDAAGILDRIATSPFTRLPVYRGTLDNVVGVINSKVVLRDVWARRGDVGGLQLSSLMAEPWFVPESTNLIQQLQNFRRRREHFALIVDEYGALQGIVTLEDILEEIVGDVLDEHDKLTAGVRTEPGGSYVVSGSTTIRDLNRRFDWSLPDEEAATVAGLLMHRARRIPAVGQVIAVGGLRFEVLRRRRNRITQIRITPEARPEG